MKLTFASYNIHKGVGLDGRRDADRIIRVLHELNVDVLALQETDRRFGRRAAVLPRSLLEEAQWQIAPLKMRPSSMGWHGNSILVRPDTEIHEVESIELPSLEPRGAVRALLSREGTYFDVVGMHLDLSGLLRRKQIEAVCHAMSRSDMPSVLMGDFNEWSPRGGAQRAFGKGWNVLAPGRSFPSRRPLAGLDRIVHSNHWKAAEHGVHHSSLAVSASDHLPVRAELELL